MLLPVQPTHLNILPKSLSLSCKPTVTNTCIGDNSLEHLAEVLSEVVAGGSLDRPAGARDVRLHRGSLVPPRKLLRLGLRACVNHQTSIVRQTQRSFVP